MFSSELICDAMPSLQTSTEAMHSKNMEAINDSTLYNRNKKLMHQNTTYITYFSLEKKFQLVNILYRWISGSTEVNEY